MADYSYAVPEEMILDRSPYNLSYAPLAWEHAILQIYDTGTVSVTTWDCYGDNKVTTDKRNKLTIRVKFADSRNGRQKIDTDRLKADLVNGGRLSVLIDRITAGHTVEFDGNNMAGTFTDDARAALDDLQAAMDQSDRYIDMNWMDEDDAENDE